MGKVRPHLVAGLVDKCPEENGFLHHHESRILKIHVFFFHGPTLWVRKRFVVPFRPDQGPPRANTAANFANAERIALDAL